MRIQRTSQLPRANEAEPHASRARLEIRQRAVERRDAELSGSEARTTRRNAAQEELDRKLDRALECTFPASDAFRLSSAVPAREPDNVRTVREAVGVFERVADFQGAIDELLNSGFDRAALSLLAAEHAVAEKLGHHYAKVGSLADHPAIPRTAYVSAEAIGDGAGGLIGGLMYIGAVAAAGAVVASGGTLAAAIGATVLAGGTGGVIGSILAKWLADHHARYLQEQIDRGGLLLWVATRSPNEETRAIEILRKHSGVEVHVHALPAAA
jgi:hypothetical protein